MAKKSWPAIVFVFAAYFKSGDMGVKVMVKKLFHIWVHIEHKYSGHLLFWDCSAPFSYFIQVWCLVSLSTCHVIRLPKYSTARWFDLKALNVEALAIAYLNLAALQLSQENPNSISQHPDCLGI